MANTSLATQPRKRRFRLQFSLSAFLIVATLIGIVLAPWIARTRKQMRVCEQMKSARQHIILHDPPAWPQFLPSSWLKIADGHWCRNVREVVVSMDGRGYEAPATPQERLANFRNQLQLLATLPSLDEIQISIDDIECPPSELSDCLTILQQVEGLKKIRLIGIEADHVFSLLPSMPRLRAISVFNYRLGLTDSDIAHVSKFPQLEDLSIDAPNVLGASLKTVASLKHLKHVDFGTARFVASDLQWFANHPTLEQLDANGSMDDEAVKILVSCPNLKWLNLSGAPITDIGLSYLENATKLRTIFLDGTVISDAGFASLSHCKSLESIHASSCKLSNSIAPTLRQLPLLDSLDLNDTLVTDKLLPQLATLKNLKHIVLNHVIADVDDIVDLLAQDPIRQQRSWRSPSWQQAYYHFGNDSSYAPEFDPTSLDLSNLRGIGGRIHQVRDLASVTKATLTGTDINDSDLQALASICNLEELDLSTNTITAAGLQAFQNESSLTSLHVVPSANFDEILPAIGTISSLTSLKLAYIDRLTESNIASILKLQNLTSLRIHGCESPPALVRLLCQLPNLTDLRWNANLEYDLAQIENVRLQHAREILGVPSGFQSRISALNAAIQSSNNPSHTLVTIADEAEVSVLGNIQIPTLSASNVPLTSQGAATLLLYPSVNSLDLSNTGINDQALSVCVSSHVASLNLANNPITDAAVDSLIQMKSLHNLSLANTHISDIGVSRILQTMTLSSLNLSGTRVTAQAWAGLDRTEPPVDYTLGLFGVPNVSDILSAMSSHLLPGRIDTGDNDSYIGSWTVRVLRNEVPASKMTEIDICPELLDAWSIEKILNDKSRVGELHTHGTGRVTEISRIATQECPLIRTYSFHNEAFDSDDALALPTRLQSISFDHCSLSTSVLDSLSSSRYLRDVYFSDCDFTGCCLEPLLQVKSLARAHRRNTSLNADQLQTWNQLQSTLLPP